MHTFPMGVFFVHNIDYLQYQHYSSLARCHETYYNNMYKSLKK